MLTNHTADSGVKDVLYINEGWDIVVFTRHVGELYDGIELRI
jgi:hypothetical protein